MSLPPLSEGAVHARVAEVLVASFTSGVPGLPGLSAHDTVQSSPSSLSTTAYTLCGKNCTIIFRDNFVKFHLNFVKFGTHIHIFSIIRVFHVVLQRKMGNQLRQNSAPCTLKQATASSRDAGLHNRPDLNTVDYRIWEVLQDLSTASVGCR